jgi:hypothetical protein
MVSLRSAGPNWKTWGLSTIVPCEKLMLDSLSNLCQRNNKLSDMQVNHDKPSMTFLVWLETAAELALLCPSLLVFVVLNLRCITPLVSYLPIGRFLVPTSDADHSLHGLKEALPQIWLAMQQTIPPRWKSEEIERDWNHKMCWSGKSIAPAPPQSSQRFSWMAFDGEVLSVKAILSLKLPLRRSTHHRIVSGSITFSSIPTRTV